MKCHSTFCILGVIVVGEVALHVVHPGWRMSSISAVADEAAHCSRRFLFERCHGLTILDFGGGSGIRGSGGEDGKGEGGKGEGGGREEGEGLEEGEH